MKELGYVYILTNPRFEEDWVKIGRSSRPVDIRSEELDKTAPAFLETRRKLVAARLKEYYFLL